MDEGIDQETPLTISKNLPFTPTYKHTSPTIQTPFTFHSAEGIARRRMSKNTHAEKPSSTPCAGETCNSRRKTQKMMPFFAYLILTGSTMSSAYSAYTSKNPSLAAFVVSLYLGYIAMIWSVSALNRLPEEEESVKKRLLKIAVWFLASGILFSFSYQFSKFMNVAATAFAFGIAGATSSCIFYFYFLNESQIGRNISSRIDKARMFQSSRSQETSADDDETRKLLHSAPPNV